MSSDFTSTMGCSVDCLSNTIGFSPRGSLHGVAVDVETSDGTMGWAIDMARSEAATIATHTAVRRVFFPIYRYPIYFFLRSLFHNCSGTDGWNRLRCITFHIFDILIYKNGWDNRFHV